MDDQYIKEGYFAARIGTEILAGLATGGAANYAKGATALNYIAKGACILDVAGNASQVGMGVNDVIETGSLSFSNTLQIVGGGFGLGGNFTGLMKSGKMLDKVPETPLPGPLCVLSFR